MLLRNICILTLAGRDITCREEAAITIGKLFITNNRIIKLRLLQDPSEVVHYLGAQRNHSENHKTMRAKTIIGQARVIHNKQN